MQVDQYYANLRSQQQYSGKMAFIFSVSIELLQLFLRLGTFQLSDIFYNTVGGVIGGVCYLEVIKVRKQL